MGELLNLDELLPEEKHIVFKGEKHPIIAGTVESWLRMMSLRQGILKMAEDAEKVGEDGQTDVEGASRMLEMQIDVIAMACPSMKREDLLGLPITALTKLAEIVTTELSGGASDAPGDEQGEVPAEEGVTLM